MSDLGNKEIMAQNLSYYMEREGKTKLDVAKAIGVPYSTFLDWANAKAYPRIDKIEKLASYFKILKSDLIEKRKDILDIKTTSEVIAERAALLSQANQEAVLSYVEFLITSEKK